MRFFVSYFVLLLLYSCNPELPVNIVIINVDDLGWKDLSVMGSEYYETPHIDSLFSKGMTFSNAYAAASNCAPSRASMMTGLWTTRHGIFTVGNSDRGKAKHRKLVPIKNKTVLSDSIPTLPEILKQKGFHTIHAGKWHISKDPLLRGIDINIGGASNGHPRSYYPPYINVDLHPDTCIRLTDYIMEQTIRHIDTVQTPFFLNYAPYAVHTPIQAIEPLYEKYDSKDGSNGQSNAEYATMIENLDHNVGKLLQKLEESGLIKSTVIVFTSDNGGLYGITDQQPLRAGKGSYYEGGIRVPFSISWHSVISEHSKSDQEVSQLDILPTLMSIIGNGETNTRYDGIDLLPILTKQQEHIDRNLFWHFPIYLQAYQPKDNQNRDSLFRTRPGSVIRSGDWKLHYYDEDQGLELYNIKTDLSEKFNIALQYPNKTKELLDLLSVWKKTTNAPVPIQLNPEFLPL